MAVIAAALCWGGQALAAPGATQPLPGSSWCQASNLASSPSDRAIRAAPADGYVPEQCLPSPAWFSPYGGAEASLVEASEGSKYGPTDDTDLVVMPDGNAYMLWGPKASDFQTTEVRELSPSGRVLWSTGIANDTALRGNARVLIAQGIDGATVIDPDTHRVTPVELPLQAQASEGGVTTQTTVGAVGNLAVLVTSAMNSMGQDYPAVSAEVQVYTAAGRLVRHFSVKDRPGLLEGDVPDDQASIQVRGSTAYIVYSAAEGTPKPAGSGAGVYDLTAADGLSGPYAIPGSLGVGPFLALPDGRLLLTDPGPQNSMSQAALYAVGKTGLRRLWSSELPGGDPVRDGSYVVTSGPAVAYATPPDPTITVWTWRTGHVIRQIALDDLLDATALAAGPFGVVAFGLPREPKPGECGALCTPELPEEVLLIGADGRIAWQIFLPPNSAQQMMNPQVLRLGGRLALDLGPPDLGVVWGGADSAASPRAATEPYTPVAAQAPRPVRVRTDVASYALSYDGQPIDSAHPLSVSAAEAGKTLGLTVSAVNAKGVAVPSPHAVTVSVTDGGAGGRVAGVRDQNTLGLAAGQSSATITYDNPSPGSYVLTAQPYINTQRTLTPDLPAFVPAYASVGAWINLADPNGVAPTLLPGEGVQVDAGGPGVQTSTAMAQPAGRGLYLAQIRTGAPASYAALAGRLVKDGLRASPPSDPAQATVSEGRPPTVTAKRVSGGVRVTVRANTRAHPMGFALYRAVGAGAATAGAAEPIAMLDPVSYGDESATYVDPAGASAYAYWAAAVYAEGAQGAMSKAVRVP